MIKIGVIGTGGMANGHAQSFNAIKGVKVAACCDVLPERAKAFAERHKVPAVYTDYRKMLAREDLDGITNVTSDAAHCAVALAVIERGLPILSEKPMAATLAEARRMAAAARRRRVVNMVNFSYRNSCGLQAAAKAIAAGGIGQVLHVEASYLQSWLVARNWGDWRNSTALVWRLSTRHGSNGVLGDIGCHIYDMTCLLAGDIARIGCTLKTFDKGVPGNRLGEYVFDANDSFVSNVVFANGAVGTIHSTRWAAGHANSLRVRVYGNEGGLEIDLDEDWKGYRICRGRKNLDKVAWQKVKCPPTPSNYQRFIRAIRTGKNDPSDFLNGLKVQAYLHYSIASDKLGRAVKVAF